MATTFPTYPATTFEQAVELSIFASNQLHNVINGDATTTIETENGDIPSVRKALVDNFFFKTPVRWTNGESSTLFNQLYYFYEDEVVNGWYYAPSATTDNPVSLGSTPVGDDNWVLYTPVSRSTPSEVYPWYVEITQEQTSVSPPYTFDTAIVVYNGIVLTATKDYTITDSVINFTSPLEIEPDAEYPDILFCYLGKVQEGDPSTNYVTYASLASSGGASVIGTTSGLNLQQDLDSRIKYEELSSNSGLTYIGFGTSYGDIRAIEPTKDGQACFLKLPNIIGLIEYVYDIYDSTSLDDSGSILVTSSGKRWKISRNINNGIDNYGLSFNPSAVQVLTNAYTGLNNIGKPYSGLTNEKFPGRGIKLWRETQGTLENATILSIRNATTAQSDPSIPVLAVDSFTSRAAYANRDHVGMYLGMDSQAPIVTTTNTTFTATSVTSPDLASALASGRIKVGVLIDTTDAPKKTGKVTALNTTTNTLTVDAWVTAGGGGATTTPTNGVGIKVNPMGGLWCANWILGLNSAHDVSTAAYIMEGDIRNDKATGAGHGMYMRCADSSYACGNAFWAVGGSTQHWTTGFAAQYCDTGFYVDNTSDIGFWSNNSPIGLRIRGATTPIVIGTAATTYTSWDAIGTVSGLRWKATTFAASSTIDTSSVVCYGPTVTTNTTINLPEPTDARELGRILILKNPTSSTANIFFAGGVESGSGSIIVRPSESYVVQCNGTLWITIAKNLRTDEVAGNGTLTATSTSITISHTLGSTPMAVVVTPTSSYTGSYWVSAKTSSTFTLTFSGAQAANVTFDWILRR